MPKKEKDKQGKEGINEYFPKEIKILLNPEMLRTDYIKTYPENKVCESVHSE